MTRRDRRGADDSAVLLVRVTEVIQSAPIATTQPLALSYATGVASPATGTALPFHCGAERATCLLTIRATTYHARDDNSFFVEGGAMNFIEKSAIATNEYRLGVYRSCPNFAQ